MVGPLARVARDPPGRRPGGGRRRAGRVRRPPPRRRRAGGQVLDDLARAWEPGLVASPGPRYFGFVTGGTLPAALGAEWLVTAADQNAGTYVMSPAAAVIEDVAAAWVLDLLGLPDDAALGFVTGAQMANVTCLAAARRSLLAARGWDAEARRARRGAGPDRADRRPGPRDPGPGAAAARPRVGAGGARGRRRPGPDAGGRPAGAARRGRGPGAGVRPGRERGHRGVRPPRRDRRPPRRPGRHLAARRRRLRALGRRGTGPAAPRRGRGARRLVGGRRAQVAQRPLRLRDGDRPRPPRP